MNKIPLDLINGLDFIKIKNEKYLDFYTRSCPFQVLFPVCQTTRLVSLIFNKNLCFELQSVASYHPSLQN